MDILLAIAVLCLASTVILALVVILDRVVRGALGMSGRLSSLQSISISIALAAALIGYLMIPQYADYTGHARLFGPGDRVLANLTKGSAVFTAPTEVSQFEDFEVTLNVSARQLEKALKLDPETSSSGYTVKGIDNVLLSPRMSAELIGPDFSIAEAGAREQVVTLRSDTSWKWTVRAEWPGTRSLRVRLNTLMKVAGEETPRTVDVATAQISVHVNASEWAMRHWEWIITALVIPLVGWVAKIVFGKPGEGK